MLEKIREYISLQETLLRKIRQSFDGSLEDFEDTQLDGWQLHSHGEHLCCIEAATGKQVEIPINGTSQTGIDAGHFDYYLESIGSGSLGYNEMHNELIRLEREGYLKQVQIAKVPTLWNLI